MKVLITTTFVKIEPVEKLEDGETWENVIEAARDGARESILSDLPGSDDIILVTTDAVIIEDDSTLYTPYTNKHDRSQRNNPNS